MHCGLVCGGCARYAEAIGDGYQKVRYSVKALGEIVSVSGAIHGESGESGGI